LKNPSVVEKLQIRYQDLDPYGHVNNAVHMIFFETTRIAYFKALAQAAGIGPWRPGIYRGCATSSPRRPSGTSPRSS
jgi:acyl-CoA thioester hydrolase